MTTPTSPALRVLAALALLASPAQALYAQSVSSLRVMTFNVWTGENTAAGRSKLTEIIQASGADIVGAQELGDAAGRSIAAALGFHYHQQSGGDIQVLSRYPIVGQSPANLGVEISIAPDRNVWLFNAHLAAYPYQPYDLRDGILPLSETAVIAAANAARGSQVSSYLNDMTGVLSSGAPVFFTGDFNEPSHLDWTAEAAAATTRPFDFEVQYPASSRIVAAGLTDSFRAARPDEVADSGYTWTPGYPPPLLAPGEVHDRIDIVYHRGAGISAVSASTVGPLDGDPNTDLAIAGYNADHRAVVVDFSIPGCLLFGDLNGDCLLDVADWHILRLHQHAELLGLTPAEAYAKGDLNGDLRNDHTDFVMFKGRFEIINGPGAFAEMLAVPEPSTLALALGLFPGIRHRLGRRWGARPHLA